MAAADLGATTARWPRFVPAARRTGFEVVRALPMRLRSEVIGALNLFTAQAQDLDAETLRLGPGTRRRGQHRPAPGRGTVRQRDALTEQLQTALNTRVLIEQAKGVIAERHHVNRDAAFTLLRASARNHNRRLADFSRTAPWWRAARGCGGRLVVAASGTR